MKIQTLKIRNIASIEEAVINFDQAPLADDPIFLITGETGAGKTTILNAICLALYNKVPALTTIASAEKDRDDVLTNNPRQLLRRGTAKGAVELSFVGNNGKHYLATWQVQRAGKRIDGKMQQTRRTVTVTDSQESVTYVKTNEIEQVLHEALALTFEQFTRTTMLAQGQFANFMKASDNDKSEILEKLTGTELYASIGRQVYELTQAAIDNYKTIDNQIRGAQLMNDDEKQSLIATNAQLSVEIKQLDTELAQLNAQIQWLTQYEHLCKTLSEKQREHQAAQDVVASEAHKQRMALVRDYEATTEIRELLAQATSNERELEASQQQQAAMSEVYATIAGGIEWHSQQLVDLNKQGERLTAALDKAIEAFEQQNRLVKRLDEAIAADTLPRLTDSVRTIDNELKRVGDTMAVIKQWRQLCDEQVEVERHLNEQRAEQARQQQMLSEQQALLPALQLEYAREQGYYEGQKKLSDHIRDLRAQFEATHVCPLCGTEGVQLIDEGSLSDKLATAQQKASAAKGALDNANAEIAKCQASVQALATAIKMSEKQAKSKATEAQAKEAVCASSYEQYAAPDALDTLQALDAQLNAQRRDEQAALDKATKQQNELRDARQRLDVLRQAKERAAKDVDKNSAQIKEVEQLISNTEESLSNVQHAAIEQCKAVRCKDLKQQVNLYVTRMNNILGRIEQTTSRIKAQQQNINGYFAQTDSYARQRVDELCGIKREEIELNKQTIVQADKCLVIASTAVTTVSEQLDKHCAVRPLFENDATRDTLLALKQAKDKERQETNNTLVANNTQLERDRALVASLAEKEALRQRLRVEKDNWEVLDRAFGGADGKKFRNIAQSYVLRALLVRANYYLTMFNNRYLLDCEDGSLTINVIDNFQGGAVRNVGLLSGGEGFVVSLALALGLASISDTTLSVDTLFIDEGFGTLSREHLEMVIDTLDRLHQLGGRRVGIISHVEELKERIPTQIRLRRTGPSSSSVEVLSI